MYVDMEDKKLYAVVVSETFTKTVYVRANDEQEAGGLVSEYTSEVYFGDEMESLGYKFDDTQEITIGSVDESEIIN